MDRLTKLAAEGKSSAKPSLPRLLHKPIPANKATLKQTFTKSLSAKQQAMWKLSKRKKAMERIGFTKLGKTFSKLVGTLSRPEAALLIQLRIGHAPLNKYLHRIGKVDRPSCPACNASEEMVAHFIQWCPKYTHERWPLRCAAGRRDLLRFALNDEKGIRLLMNFIRQTERFERDERGDGSGFATAGRKEVDGDLDGESDG